MLFTRRQRGWLIGLVFLVTILTFLFYPMILFDSPLAILFTVTEIGVIVMLFGGMLFLLGLLLYLGQ